MCVPVHNDHAGNESSGLGLPLLLLLPPSAALAYGCHCFAELKLVTPIPGRVKNGKIHRRKN